MLFFEHHAGRLMADTQPYDNQLAAETADNPFRTLETGNTPSEECSRGPLAVIRQHWPVIAGVFAISFLVPVLFSYSFQTNQQISDAGDPEAAVRHIHPVHRIAALPIHILRKLYTTEKYVTASDLASLDQYEFAKRVEISRRMALEVAELADKLRSSAQEYGGSEAPASSLVAASDTMGESIPRYFDNLLRRIALIDKSIGMGVLEEKEPEAAPPQEAARVGSTAEYLIAVHDLQAEKQAILKQISDAEEQILGWYDEECARIGECAAGR